METLDEILKRLNTRSADINKRFTSSEYIANEEANELFASTEQDFNRARRLNNIEKALATQNYIKNAYKANSSALDYPDLTRITTIADDAKRYEKIRDFEFGKLENSLKYLKNLEIIAQKERDLNNSYSLAKAKMNQWKEQRAEQLNEEAYQRAANALGLLDLKSKQKEWDDKLSLEQEIGESVYKAQWDKMVEKLNAEIANNNALARKENLTADQAEDKIKERKEMFKHMSEKTGKSEPEIYALLNSGGVYRDGKFKYPEEMTAEMNSLLGSNGSSNSNSSNSNSSNSNTASNNQSTSSNNQSNTDASASLAKSSKSFSSLYSKDNNNNSNNNNNNISLAKSATNATGNIKIGKDEIKLLEDNGVIPSASGFLANQIIDGKFDISTQLNSGYTKTVTQDAKALNGKEFFEKYGINRQVFLDRVDSGDRILYKKDPKTGKYTVFTDYRLPDDMTDNEYKSFRRDELGKKLGSDGTSSDYTDLDGNPITPEDYLRNVKPFEGYIFISKRRYQSDIKNQGKDFMRIKEQLEKSFENEGLEDHEIKGKMGGILNSAKAKAVLSLASMLFPNVDFTYNKNFRDTILAMVDDSNNLEFAKIVKKLDDEKLSHTDSQNLRIKLEVIDKVIQHLNINNDNALLGHYQKAPIFDSNKNNLTDTYNLIRIDPEIVEKKFKEVLAEKRVKEETERIEEEKRKEMQKKREEEELQRILSLTPENSYYSSND
ncbi:hypothetical protein KDD93_08595 [Campylobacter sp. faydin G-24]|uniref:Large polyvalent protein-associated domain-containing protein n=1 Tax=Campylobacter anatolicus TaxID=2829105 RepID=A0ABS5HKR0_9BACT|nr:hypothetical protein [Campylobacter anatolicus]MBR8464615.1 hypothetical protein [Campylobacter anatolicus]